MRYSLKSYHFIFSAFLYLGITNSTFAETEQQLMTSGQWKDTTTGLVWMRCSIGQTWTGETCSGNVKKMELRREVVPFLETLNQSGGFAGYTDWRLPTITELAALRQCSTGWQSDIIGKKATVQGTVEDIRGGIKMVPFTTMRNSFEGEIPDTRKQIPLSCATNEQQPTLNNNIFPNTLRFRYWTQSNSINMTDNKPIYVDFRNGYIDSQDWSYANGVRLVRGKKIDFSNKSISYDQIQPAQSPVLNKFLKFLSE